MKCPKCGEIFEKPNAVCETFMNGERLLWFSFEELLTWAQMKISERTKAGLERAKAQGKKLERPRVPEKIRKAIINMRNRGDSIAIIRCRIGNEYYDYSISESGVRKILREVRNA